MTISTDGLISMEFFNRTKTLTLVYERDASYSLTEIIEYADDMAKRIIIMEGALLLHTITKDVDQWRMADVSH